MMSRAGMPTGLSWIRRRQRALARSVLALFCLAWLQMAALPCVMAHPAEGSGPGAAVSLAGDSDAMDHGAHGMHAHHGIGDAGHQTSRHCIYCPADSGQMAGSGDEQCSFPHDPQVDARAAGAVLVPPLAVAYTVVSIPIAAIRFPPQRAASAARPTPLTISFCRFIE
jgi:hypothetical protein